MRDTALPRRISVPSSLGESSPRNPGGGLVNPGYEGTGVRKGRGSVATPMDNVVDEIDMDDFILEIDEQQPVQERGWHNMDGASPSTDSNHKVIMLF